MMTRDQAITRMLAVFPTASDGAQLANDMVFAQRLLLALQALDVVKLDAEAQEQRGTGLGGGADVIASFDTSA